MCDPQLPRDVTALSEKPKELHGVTGRLTSVQV